MCRLHRLGCSVSPLADWKLFCSGTSEHDCSATWLRAKLLRAAFGWSFGLKQMTHWDYPFLLLQDFGQCCFYFCLFVYSCIYKGKVFQCLWKANTRQDWEQPETMLASAKAFPSSHQSTPGFPDNSPIPSCASPEQWLKIAPLCWFLLVVSF